MGSRDDLESLNRNVSGSDGQEYRIRAYHGAGGHGPVFLMAPRGTPAILRNAVRVLNLGLRAAQPATSSRSYTELGVFVTGSDARSARIHAVEFKGLHDGETKASQIVRMIESGTFRPNGQ